MGLVLAAISALVYGCADFCGGKATRTAPATTVTFLSQSSGLLILFIGVLLIPGDGPSVRAIGFGALGGLFGASGILFLYHGLSTGKMSIVSPVAAVISAGLPVLVAMIFFGERPSTFAIVGILSALIAIALVSSSHGDPSANSSVSGSILTAVGAGVSFGLFFVCLQRAGSPSEVGLWALVGARPVSIGASAMLARFRGDPLRVPRADRRMIVLAGVLDQLANVLYVLAIGRNLFALIAVLASMFPVSTVALAYFVDHEKVNRLQRVGLMFALASLVLIAIPSDSSGDSQANWPSNLERKAL
jgi:uncharacterized membrane protein